MCQSGTVSLSVVQHQSDEEGVVAWEFAHHRGAAVPAELMIRFAPCALRVGEAITVGAMSHEATPLTRSHIVSCAPLSARYLWHKALATLLASLEPFSWPRFRQSPPIVAVFVLRRAHSYDLALVSSEPASVSIATVGVLAAFGVLFAVDQGSPLGGRFSSPRIVVRWRPQGEQYTVNEAMSGVTVSVYGLPRPAVRTLRCFRIRPAPAEQAVVIRRVVDTDDEGIAAELGDITLAQSGEHLFVFTVDVPAALQHHVPSPTCRLNPFRVLERPC
jgi:hypothetical protein